MFSDQNNERQSDPTGPSAGHLLSHVCSFFRAKIRTHERSKRKSPLRFSWRTCFAHAGLGERPFIFSKRSSPSENLRSLSQASAYRFLLHRASLAPSLPLSASTNYPTQPKILTGSTLRRRLHEPDFPGVIHLG